MCGISGIINFKHKKNAHTFTERVKAMNETMAHRGPDDSGHVTLDNGKILFGHRRLSILDVSKSGKQPMMDSSNRFVITFNGEIYNYLELKLQLVAKGYQFRNNTDTEVLLNAFAEWGEDCLTKFDGMFAFLIYDTQKSEIFGAIDPFGEKPLHYTIHDEVFYFASEIDALKTIDEIDFSISEESLSEYFAFQYIPSPKTIYKQVSKISPGSFFTIKQDSVLREKKYYSFEPKPIKESNRSIDDYADELEQILSQSMERRIRADVEVGLFLSGGIDSSLTHAILSNTKRQSIDSFSIGFKEQEDSEHFMAQKISKHLGGRNHTKFISENDLGITQSIYSKLGEPIADSSITPTWLLSQFTSESVKVALSGDGADELFGGYDRYGAQRQRDQLTAIDHPLEYYLSKVRLFSDPELCELLRNEKHYYQNFLDTLRSSVQNASDLSSKRKIDVNSYLPYAVLHKVDRMSMLNSLEVRTPFLSLPVANFAEKLPEGLLRERNSGKIILKHLLKRHLPEACLSEQKRGFGIPNKPQYREELVNKLSSHYNENPEFFEWSRLDLQKIHKLNENSIYQINSILCLVEFLKAKEIEGEMGISEWNSFLKISYKLKKGNAYLLIHDDSRDLSVLRIFEKTMELRFDYQQVIDNEVKLNENLCFKKDAYEGLIVFLGPNTKIHLESFSKHHLFIFKNGNWTQFLKGKHISLTGHSLPNEFLGTLFHKTKINKIFTINPRGTDWVYRQLFRGKSSTLWDFANRTYTAVIRDKVDTVKFEKNSLRYLEKFIHKTNSNDIEKMANKPRRALLVIKNLATGGAEKQVVLLACLLKTKGIQVSVFLFDSNARNNYFFLEMLKENGIPIFNHETCLKEFKNRDLESLLQLPNYIRRECMELTAAVNAFKPCIIHSYLDSNNIVTGVVSTICNIPKVIFSFRNTSPNNLKNNRRWYKKYYRTLIKNKRIQLSSNSILGIHDYSKWLGISKKKILLTENLAYGKLSKITKKEARTQLAYELKIESSLANTLIVGGLFRLEHQKQPHVFIETLKTLSSKVEFLMGVIIGNGMLYGECSLLIKKHGLDKNVFLLGQRDNVNDYLPAFDILLHTALHEGFPNSLCEAQLNSIPVVALDSGDISKIIDHNRSGFVAQKYNAKSLSTFCNKLLLNPSLRDKFGRKAKEIQRKRIFEKQSEKQISNLYQI